MILSCNSGGINFSNIHKVAPIDYHQWSWPGQNSASCSHLPYQVLHHNRRIRDDWRFFSCSVVKLWDQFEEQELCTETEVWVGCGVSDQWPVTANPTHALLYNAMHSGGLSNNGRSSEYVHLPAGSSANWLCYVLFFGSSTPLLLYSFSFLLQLTFVFGTENPLLSLSFYSSREYFFFILF